MFLPISGALLGFTAALLAEVAGGHHDASIFYDAALALRSGVDPYTWISARWSGDWQYLYYPLPALLLWLPFTVFGSAGFHIAWAAFGGFALGLATNKRRAMAPVLVSGAFFAASGEGQWSPLLTAGVVLPLAWVWVAKPSIGLALAVGWPKRELWWGAALLVGSLFVAPRWPLGWIEGLRHAHHPAPILRPGGFLLLLALRRWRVPEARLVAAFAVIPHALNVYEAVPLFLCCRTKGESYALAALTMACLLLVWLFAGGGSVVQVADRVWPLMLAMIYLPALAMVLRTINSPAD